MAQQLAIKAAETTIHAEIAQRPGMSPTWEGIRNVLSAAFSAHLGESLAVDDLEALQVGDVVENTDGVAGIISHLVSSGDAIGMAYRYRVVYVGTSGRYYTYVWSRAELKLIHRKVS